MIFKNMSDLHKYRESEERVVLPELEICDAHHHLWEYPDAVYQWQQLEQDIDTSGHNIVSTIYMECLSKFRESGPEALKPVGEVEYVLAQTQEYKQNSLSSKLDINTGIVTLADLRLGAEVAQTLDAQLDVGENKVKGIRFATGWHEEQAIKNSHTNPEAGFMLSDTFANGFAQLEKRGLSFDAWLYHTQIDELAVIADKFPHTSIILDHMGGTLGIGSYKQQDIFPSWKQSIQNLAQRENVYIKLGGFGMPIFGRDWHKAKSQVSSEKIATQAEPWIEYAIAQFGVNRCMFESNFPVDKVSFSYGHMWNAYKKVTHNYSQMELGSLFRHTAEEVYKLTATD